MRRRGIVVPDFKEVITLTPDTTVVDSVVIGVPQFLLDQAMSADSTSGNVTPRQDTPSETTPGNGSHGTQ